MTDKITDRLRVTEAEGRPLPLHDLRYEAAAEIDSLLGEINRLHDWRQRALTAMLTAQWALQQPLDGWKGDCERQALDVLRPLLNREQQP